MIRIFQNTDKIQNMQLEDESSFSIWFWIALVEFLMIVILLVILLRRNFTSKNVNEQSEELKKAKNTNINMDDLMGDINHSKDLYKELSRVCHPDKFINSELEHKAELIFQEISKNKRNYKKLLELKERAKVELNLNFN